MDDLVEILTASVERAQSVENERATGGKVADHVLKLRTAARLWSGKRQRRVIVRDAIVHARFALNGDTPVLVALIVDGCDRPTLGESVRFHFGKECLPIRRSLELRFADRADPAILTEM